MAECWFIDAFTGPDCAGNRAVVTLLDQAMAPDRMQHMATELACPAVAFVMRQPHGGAHDLRWFSPAGEITLCGHGALAAGHILLATSAAQAIRLRTSDGRELALRRDGGAGRYELSLPALAGTTCATAEWVELLGDEPQAMLWNPAGYAAAIFTSAAQVCALTPDLALLAARGNIQLSVSAQDDVLTDGPSRIVSRVFSASAGEDHATASAHALLAPYWCGRLGVDQLIARQASPHGGLLRCRVEGDRVWLGGQCLTRGGPQPYLCG